LSYVGQARVGGNRSHPPLQAEEEDLRAGYFPAISSSMPLACQNIL